MSKSKHEFHRNIAIIIGINDYSNGVPRLETAVPDAEEFARLMQERYQYEVHLLLNEKATLNQLKELIDCFRKKKILFGKNPEINDKDRIILYFAGHGIALDAKEKQEGPVGYLIPQDATDNPDTYLKMQDFHDALLELPCRHLLVILDCCFSGAFYWSSINRDVVPKVKVYKQVYDHYIKYPAWQVITSTSDKQTAIDSPRGKVVVGSKVHSPFAKHLFDALNKGADLDNDGIITANDLFNFVRKAVAVETEEYKAQTPGICPLKRHQNGEYLFLLQSEPNLEDAPPLSLENSPYRGLKSYEEEDENLYFGRKEQIEQLSEKVNNSNHRALTVVLGASGTGKSSLVKAGLIPFLKKQKLETNSSLGTWQILKSIRLSESPLTALKNSLSQELNFIDYHSDCDQPQADEPKGFSKILSWFGIRRESNRAKQNQPLEKQVEFLSQNLKNWFDKNSGSTLMLTIDQFEELITLQPRQEQKEQNKKQKQKKKREEKHREKTQQELVLKWLPQVMSQYGERLRIVLTLRSDFEAQFKDGELKDYWKEEARFHIKEMTTAELREAITEPASKRSIFFVPNTLIDKLVDEVAGMPGTLPLLSFTLHELYRLFIEDINDGDKDARKDDRAITDKYYGTLGGVARSLTKKAEDEYDNLVNQDKAYEQTIRRVMLRMVAVGGSELARRRVLKSELEYPEPENTRVLKVVKTFVDARLLVEGNNAENKPYVEPAHDALVRGWERLLKWKQEEEENLILQRQLTPAAVEWKIERSQTKGYLWHNNPRLDLLKKELKSNDKWFNQLETEFVQLSIARKTLLARRFTIGAVVVIILLSAGLIASLIGQRNARIGQIRASQQASEANFISNQQLNALLNSLQAAKTLKDWPWYLSWFKPEHQSPFFESDNELQPQVVNTLRKVFYVGQERYRLKLLRQRVLSSFWVKDGDSNSLNDQKLIIATTPKKGFVRLLDLKDNLETTFKAHNDEVRAVTFSPPTNQMATISNEKIIRFWDLKGNNIAPQINLDKVSNDVIDDLVFSPDGKQLAITKKKNNNTYQTISLLCNLASKSCQNFQGSKDETVGVRFNLNNQPIVATKTDRLVNILEGTGKTIASFSRDKLGDININGIVFNPNGKQAVIFAGEDSSYPYLLNWSNSQNQTKLEPEPLGELQSTKITGFSDNGNFSPDGKKFASGGREGIIRLWKWENNLEDRTELPELKGHQGGVRRVYFSPDSKQLISIGDDGTTRLWDLDKEPLVRIESNLQLSKQKANLLAFSNDKRLIATLEKDGTILLSNLSGEQQLPTPVALRSKSIKEPLLSPDNQQLQANVHNEASGELANKLFLQDSSGNKLIELDETMNNTNNGEVLKFSADSNLMAKVDYNGAVKLWDVWGNQKLMEFNVYPNIKDITFSSDGSLLATVTKNDTISLWEVGGLDELISWSCQRLGNYLKNSNADVGESDKGLCDGISGIEKAGKISISDKILVPTLTHPDKQAGVEAIAAGDFSTASKHLQASLKSNLNDPEARIYLNNARIGNQKSYTIAVSVPISDINGSLEILRGVAQAQDDFNNWAKTQQGIIPIRVLIADDRNDQKIAQEIAKQLANNPDVLGVVGHFSSSVTREATQVYKDKGLVAISPVSTSVQLSDVLGKSVFRTVPNDKVAAEKLADYTLNSLKKQKAILFYNSQNEYSCSLASEFTAAFSGERGKQLERDCSKYGTSPAIFQGKQQGQILKPIDLFSPDINAANSLQGVDENTVLVLLGDTSKLNQSFEILKANKGNLPILAGDDVYGSKILGFFTKEKINNKKDMVVAISWHIENHRESSFSTTSKNIWGNRDVNWRTVTAYDAAKALIAAIKQNPNREAVATILRSDSFTADGAIEKVQFLPSGDRDGNLMELVKIVKPTSKSRSGYDYEFVPVENQTNSNQVTKSKTSK